MRYKSVFVFLLVIVSALWRPAAPGPALGQDCKTKGDWKDISILPANGAAETNIRISLSANKAQFAPGEEVILTFQADRDCYVTIMDLGTSGRIVRLWPNDLCGNDNLVTASVPRQFPGPGDQFRYTIAGPAGMERIVAYATLEKGKILSESDFQAMAQSGFKQFVGGAKDLASTFKKNADALGPSAPWGTSQLNLCIGAGAQGPAEPVQAQRVFVVAAGAPTGDLRYCKKDAQRFVDALKSRMGVVESNVRLILGADATYEGFTNSLKWLETSTQPEDTAVVYFSGHGSSIPDQGTKDEEDGKDECLVLHHTGTTPSDYQVALQQKILMLDDDFNKLLKAIPARKKIIVVDTCHSGSIHKSLGMKTGNLVAKYMPFKDAATGEVMWNLKPKADTPPNYGNDNEALLAACMDDQVSYEDQSIEAGLFTNNLLKAIEAGAKDLEQAFETAKTDTEKQTKEFAAQQGKAVSVQVPNMTDPHGFVKLFGFGK